MTRFYLLCFVLSMGARCVAPNPNPGYVYSREADAWLRLHSIPATWIEAVIHCIREGAVLASPTTTGLAQAMQSMKGSSGIRSFFTGINAIKSNRKFSSLEGVPLYSVPLEWIPSSENSKNEGYRELNYACAALTAGNALTNVSCETELSYFCRKEPRNKCGDKNNGYKYEPRTGSCYKFHREEKNWEQALPTCHAEGGHLAIINSAVESTVLKELFERNRSNPDTLYAIIGFRRNGGDKFVTINGDNLDVAGFQKWARGEPNNLRGNEYCGAITRDGLLNDYPCSSYPVSFICEITP